MAQKIRITKDITIRWRVLTNGKVESLSGRNLLLYLTDPFGRKIRLDFSVTDTNLISATFAGKDHEKLGRYTLTLAENQGQNASTALDVVDAFVLVPRTSDEGDESSCHNLEIAALDLEGDMAIGGRGMSAYEVWLSQGNEGTEADFFEAIRGPEGKKGDKGDSLYQQMVNAGRFEGTEEEFLQQYQDAVNAANNGAERAENAADEATILMSQMTVSEQERESSETSRKESEVERQASEQERKTEEESRKIAEIERNSAENSRKTEEATRQDNESTRISNESDRQAAEQERRDWFNSAIVQGRGQSTTSVMSQKATTDELAKKFDKDSIVLITEEEYDALVASGAVDPNKIYLITENND